MKNTKTNLRIVSFWGWFFLLVSVFYIVGSVIGLLTVEIEQNTQQVLKVISQKFLVTEEQWAEVLSIQKGILFANLILSILGSISSIGFIKRKEWGRLSYVYLSGLILITATIAIFPISRLLNIMTGIFERNDASSGLSPILLVPYIFGIALLGWFVKFLRSQDVRSQFK